MKILVIDDNPVDVKLFRSVLSVAGHDVRGAPAAEAALDAIKQEKPQVLLVDLSLPGMNGMTLIRKLKDDPATRGIVVIVVTGHPSFWKEAEARKAGCDAYLVKPVNTRELPQHLSEIAAHKPDTPRPNRLKKRKRDEHPHR